MALKNSEQNCRVTQQLQAPASPACGSRCHLKTSHHCPPREFCADYRALAMLTGIIWAVDVEVTAKQLLPGKQIFTVIGIFLSARPQLSARPISRNVQARTAPDRRTALLR